MSRSRAWYAVDICQEIYSCVEYKSIRLRRINLAHPTERNDEISMRYPRILNNLQHFAHESVRLHALACHFVAQSALQVSDVRVEVFFAREQEQMM